MTRCGGNIYKNSRRAAGVSRDSAMQALVISDRTLARYESGESRPPDDIVAGMVKLYRDRELGYLHLRASPIGQLILGDDLIGEILRCIKMKIASAGTLTTFRAIKKTSSKIIPRRQKRGNDGGDHYGNSGN